MHVHRTDMEDMSEVVEHRQLLLRIQKAFPECNETKCYAIYHDVLKCVGNKRYVSRERDYSLKEKLAIHLLTLY